MPALVDTATTSWKTRIALYKLAVSEALGLTGPMPRPWNPFWFLSHTNGYAIGRRHGHWGSITIIKSSRLITLYSRSLVADAQARRTVIHEIFVAVQFCRFSILNFSWEDIFLFLTHDKVGLVVISKTGKNFTVVSWIVSLTPMSLDNSYKDLGEQWFAPVNIWDIPDLFFHLSFKILIYGLYLPLTLQDSQRKITVIIINTAVIILFFILSLCNEWHFNQICIFHWRIMLTFNLLIFT